MSDIQISSRRQDSFVSDQYDAWAKVYDLFWARYINKTLPVLQRAATVMAGDRVLDLACGTGELERRMLETDGPAEIVGVDLAPSMIEQARAKLDGAEGVRFEQDTRTRYRSTTGPSTLSYAPIPFTTRTYAKRARHSGLDPESSLEWAAKARMRSRIGVRDDLLARICVSPDYFTHSVQVLGEARRVLIPNGRLVILDWCRDFRACRVMDAVLQILDPAYQHCYTLGEMRGLLKRVDFALQDQFRYRFDLVWGMMVVDVVSDRS